jgi:hypothetical protein
MLKLAGINRYVGSHSEAKLSEFVFNKNDCLLTRPRNIRGATCSPIKAACRDRLGCLGLVV